MVDEVAAGIRTITEDAAKVKALVDEVNLGSEEHSRGIQQIGEAIAQMEQVTQKDRRHRRAKCGCLRAIERAIGDLRNVATVLKRLLGAGRLAEAD